MEWISLQWRVDSNSESLQAVELVNCKRDSNQNRSTEEQQCNSKDEVCCKI
jgi:hypothetical protein